MIRFDERKCTIISEGQIFDACCISVTRVSSSKKLESGTKLITVFQYLKKIWNWNTIHWGYDKRQKFGLKFTTISNFMLSC